MQAEKIDDYLTIYNPNPYIFNVNKHAHDKWIYVGGDMKGL